MDIAALENIIRQFESRNGYRPRAIRAALIDMDGTLYDSMPWHALAWHRMVTELGIEACVDEFFGYEGMTGRDTINMLFERAYGHPATDRQVVELYERKTRYFRDNNRAEVMPGATRMVETLRRRGIVPVLVTGSGQATLMSRLTTDFDGAFPEHLRITARDVVHGKPNPEPYLRAAALAGVQPYEAIVVENAPLGVQAGVAAGILTVAVRTGPLDMALFEKAGADIIAPSMPEWADMLPGVLDFLNS